MLLIISRKSGAGTQFKKEKEFYLGKFGLKVVGYPEIGRGEGVKVVEHASGGARRRDELKHLLANGKLPVGFLVGGHIGVGETRYAAVLDGGGSYDAALGKTIAEVLDLLFDVRGCESETLNLL